MDPTTSFNHSPNTATGDISPGYYNLDSKVIAYYVIRLLQSFLALAGNSLTILAIVQTPTLRTATNVLVGSLAIADLLSSTVAPITVSTVYYADAATWVPLCITKETITMMFQAGNLYNVFYISVDRYMAVAYPIRHMLQLTIKRVSVISATTWCLSVSITILITTLSDHPNINRDNVLCFYTELLPPWILNGIILPQFIGLSLVTMILYCRMCVLIWRSGVKVTQGHTQILVGQQVHQSRQRKLTRMLMVVMGVYFAFTLPAVCLSNLVNKTNPDPDWLTDLYNVAVILWYNTSFVNPIMYAWQAPGFRRAFNHILRFPCTRPRA